MMNTYNIAILGAGHIAEKMAHTLEHLPRANSYAVASRSLEKAQQFAQRWGFSKAYGSYTDMLANPAIDLVYVATPHAMHYSHVLQCLQAGKAVLCEKAFTCNAREAETLIHEAEARKLLLAEAIWTRYMPLMQTVKQLVDSGIIGQPRTLTANLSYPISHKERIQHPDLGGGALLDIGVYTLNFATMLFGTDIKKIDSCCEKTPSGMDAQDSITLWYNDGKMAQLSSSIYVRSDRMGIISGSEGHIIVENVNNPSRLTVVNSQYQVIKTCEAPIQITGFEYEVEACLNALDHHCIEPSFMPHAETLRMMRLMDTLRQQWDVRFPNDEV